jgi:hypothetical protein
MQSKQGVRGNSHNDYTGECMLRSYLGTLFAYLLTLLNVQ